MVRRHNKLYNNSKIAESKKHAVLDDGEKEDLDVEDKEAGGKIAANDLHYLLAEKGWKEAIVNHPEADKMIDHLVSLGFKGPSKIQSKTIPFALAKKSVGIIAQSHNGSGKTLAFSLPSVLRVDLSKPLMKSQRTYLPQVIILAPNVELCTQIVKVAQNLAGIFPDLKVSRGKDAAHIIVGTPQGVTNLLNKKQIELTNLDLFVVDEADGALSGEGGGHVLSIINVMPKEAGLFFFSATFTKESMDYMDAFFKKQNLKFVLKYTLKSEELKLDGIKQFARRCDSSRKADYIDKLLNNLETDMQFIIFANTKKFAQTVYDELKKRGHEIALLMGGLRPDERSIILNDFIKGKFKTLLTTNLLARGFDQRTIGLVINLDIPKHFGEKKNQADLETYLHRIGRTGRFGDQGLAVNLYTFDDEKKMLNDVEKFYGCEIHELGKKDDHEEFRMINDFLDQVKKNNEEKRALHGERNFKAN